MTQAPTPQGRRGLIVFDLDGTLIDSVGDIHAAVNDTLARYGRASLPLDAVRRMVGEGAGRLIDLALAASPGPGVDPATALATFLDIYEAAPILHTRLYPDAAETVATLQTAGFTLAVSTNKPEQPAPADPGGVRAHPTIRRHRRRRHPCLPQARSAHAEA